MDGRSGEDDDLLTYMVVEKYLAGNGDGDRWTEEDILNQTLSFLAASRLSSTSQGSQMADNRKDTRPQRGYVCGRRSS
jgi:hypothetical protein